MAAQAAIPLRPEPWHFAARLASALARPVDHSLVAAAPEGGLERQTLQALARHPAFKGPVNRAVSRSMGLPDLDVTAAFIDRLAGDPGARLCVLLVSQPMGLVLDAALLLAAAVLHRDVVRVVFKADREKLRSVFGAGGFEVATQEALLFHGPLAELGAGLPVSELVGAEVEAGRRRAAGYGLALLGAYVDLADPALGRLFRLRVEAAGDVAGLPRAAMVADEHGEHIVRLLRRRIRPWSPLIG